MYLYEYYEVNPEDYKEINANSLNLPVRVINRFQHHRIRTVTDLLVTSWEEIDNWYGFGKGCRDALRKALTDYFGNRPIYSCISCNVNVEVLRKAYADWKFVDIDEWSTKRDLQLIEKYNQAVSSLDENDVKILLKDIEYGSVLSEALLSFSKEINAFSVFNEIVEALPTKVQLMPANKALDMFSKNHSYIDGIIDENESELPFIDVLSKHATELIDNSAFDKYRKWILMDVSGKCLELFETDKFDDRTVNVLRKRANWNTLEQVGNEVGVTRERIRQIEAKGIRVIANWNTKNRISNYVRMRFCDEGIVSSERLLALLGEYGDIILHYFRTNDSCGIRYLKEFDSYIVCDDEVFGRIQSMAETLPDLLGISEMNRILENSEYPELMRTEIMTQYKLSGDIYHRSRLTLSRIYADILQSYFPRGIHIYDDREINAFRRKIEEKYGDIKVSANNRAMGVRIADIGVLCGRGIYKPKQDKYISDELAASIYDYIIHGDSPAYLMHTIFEVFKYDLLFQGIDNRYYLQGILKEIFGDKLLFRRDYVIKDSNFTNISHSVIEYIMNNSGPVTKHELFSHFPGITEIIISLSVADNRIINLFGSYLSTTQIELSRDEIGYIKDVLDKLLREKQSIHCKDIYEMISRNYVVQPYGMFGLLEFLFADEYNFVRPFISNKDVDIEKTIDSLYTKVNEADVIELEEISAIAKEKHFQINSLSVFANSCNDTHYLISNHQLASIDYLEFDENDFSQMEKVLLEYVSETIPISGLNCVHLFPKLSIRWNEWIIYSIVNKLSVLLDVGLSSNQIKMAIPYIAPKGQLKIDDSITTNTASQTI